MSTLILNSWSMLRGLLSRALFLLGLGTLVYLVFAPQRTESPGPSEAGGLRGKVNELFEEGGPTIRQYPLTMPSARSAARLPESSAAAPAQGSGDTPAASPSPAVAETAAVGEFVEGEGLPPEGQPGDFAALAPTTPGSVEESVGAGDSSLSRMSGRDGVREEAASGSGAGMFGAFGGLFGGNSSAGSRAGALEPGATLGSQDLQLLATALKGNHHPQSVNVSGTYFPAGENSPGQPVAGFAVSTSRWGLNEGLGSDVSLAISGPDQNNLSFVLGLNLQAAGSTSWQKFTASTGVSSSRVRTEIRNGRSVRVFDLTLANFSIRPGEVLRKVSLLLALDVSSPGTPVVSNESRISFVRTEVRGSPLSWPNPVNAATESFVKAQEIPYSIDLLNAQ